MQTKAERKQAFILQQAKVIFMKKGYHAVTMTDLVMACGISRGGLYRYFKSPKDIFINMLKMDQQAGNEVIGEGMIKDVSASRLLETFLQNEKNNLLRQHPSLTTAVYEFYFEHKNELQHNWLEQQFNRAEELLTDLIQYGIDQGVFHPNDPCEIARNILFLLEGLRVSAEVMNLNERIVDGQFHLLKRQIIKDVGSR